VLIDTYGFAYYDGFSMLWLVLLAASVAAIPPKLRHASIGVFIVFDAAPSARSVAEMKNEAAKLLGSAGYEVDWRTLSQNHGNESFANVMLVKFHGKCRLEYPVSGVPEGDITLASTKVEAGHVLPFSDVQCDTIRKALSYATRGDRQRALGLALGRVVAHELYHFLANTTKHATIGLAAASHDWVELFSGTPSFRDGDFAGAAR
jgi:hypothetical protein